MTTFLSTLDMEGTLGTAGASAIRLAFLSSEYDHLHSACSFLLTVQNLSCSLEPDLTFSNLAILSASDYILMYSVRNTPNETYCVSPHTHNIIRVVDL